MNVNESLYLEGVTNHQYLGSAYAGLEDSAAYQYGAEVKTTGIDLATIW